MRLAHEQGGMDRLAALRLYVRTVETGSFTRAGRDLGLSQPQASRGVLSLEADLGARLLQRTTRRLSTTEAGQRVYDQALRLLAEEAALMEAAAGADREPVGRLRLSASVAFAAAEIAPHVSAFLDRYPRVRLDIAATDARIDPVAEGVDLIFRLGPLGDSGLTGRRLGRYERWLVTAPAMAARLDPSAPVAEQLNGRCLLFSGSTLGTRWRLDGADGAIEFEATGPVTATNGAVVQTLAVAGVGIALLPTFAVRAEMAAGRLVRVAPDWRGPCVELTALWTHRALPRKARVWLDHIAPRLLLEAG